ncbi:hypothetical protein H1215_10210, partial [Anoxybacillus sp. LAT_38]
MGQDRPVLAADLAGRHKEIMSSYIRPLSVTDEGRFCFSPEQLRSGHDKFEFLMNMGGSGMFFHVNRAHPMTRLQR